MVPRSKTSAGGVPPPQVRPCGGFPRNRTCGGFQETNMRHKPRGVAARGKGDYKTARGRGDYKTTPAPCGFPDRVIAPGESWGGGWWTQQIRVCGARRHRPCTTSEFVPITRESIGGWEVSDGGWERGGFDTVLVIEARQLIQRQGMMYRRCLP